jgi:hypothetical protein
MDHIITAALSKRPQDLVSHRVMQDSFGLAAFRGLAGEISRTG